MPPSCKDGTVEIISFHTVLFICKNFVNIIPLKSKETLFSYKRNRGNVRI